jgi:hypothetical protein
MEWISTPESSSIAAYAYSSQEMYLYVRFKNGRTYRYSGVPSSVYEDFADADSKGAFFNAQIQGRHPYSQI